MRHKHGQVGYTNKYETACRGTLRKRIAKSHSDSKQELSHPTRRHPHLDRSSERLFRRQHRGFYGQDAARAAALWHADTEGNSHAVFGAGHGRHKNARFLIQTATGVSVGENVMVLGAISMHLPFFKSLTAATTFDSSTSLMGCVSLICLANSVTDIAQSSG
jgi:hypothetical protein